MAGDDWADISIFSFVSYFTVLDIDGEIYFNFLYMYMCMCMWVGCLSIYFNVDGVCGCGDVWMCGCV